MIPIVPKFFATPETIGAVSEARAAAILIGGYDGSGNYGDLAQLDAALAILEPLEQGLLLLPVAERSRLADHRAAGGNFIHPARHALFFDPDEDHEDDLLPVPAPARLSFAVCYLYGGGYLNPSWGDRKLAMLGAAETLLVEAGVSAPWRLSSGLQIDAGWLSGLGEAELKRLRSFKLHGARDARSATALASLGSGAQVIDTGDDAVGALRRVDAGPATPAPEGGLHLNLHVAEHPWVTDRPTAVADFHADLAAKLGRRLGLPVHARPLIAYADRHVSDEGALDRLAAACTAQGVELTEPQVLQPASLAGALGKMRGAALTVSCSYHVALTSLLFGVPAVLLRDNAYYEQKAAGLAAAFDLPASLSIDSSMDPDACATEIAAVLEEPGAATLRYRLALCASAMRERRASVEAELLGRLNGAAAAALTGSLDELDERLRERSAEPAELQAELARMREQTGTPLPAGQAAADPVEAGTRAVLDELMRSRSWRMTAPLRRAGALLRRD